MITGHPVPHEWEVCTYTEKLGLGDGQATATSDIRDGIGIKRIFRVNLQMFILGHRIIILP